MKRTGKVENKHFSAHPSFKMASHVRVTVDAFLDNKLQDYSETEVQEGKRQRDGTLLILTARVSEKLPLKCKKDHFFRILKNPSFSVRRIMGDG